MIDWTPKDADKAIVMACDAGYFPFAAFLAWQIVSKSGPRDFDVVIASEEHLTLPEVLVGYGVRSVIVTLDDAFRSLPAGRLPRSSYLRLQLPGLLRDRYRRLLYLDSDMQFEGGDLSRLLDLDLYGAAIGAVRDVIHVHVPGFHAPEFRTVGLPAEKYFNSGLLLIDTPTWIDSTVVERCAALAAEWQDSFKMQDQAIINVGLAGEIAELSPVWNWMLVDGDEPLVRNVPVRINHFITGAKPYRAKGQRLDRRFREVYRDFFLIFCSDWISELPVRDSFRPPLDRRNDVSRYIRHLKRRKAIENYLAPFSDEWTVFPPRVGRADGRAE